MNQFDINKANHNIPEDFWIRQTTSPLVVLSESHHLLLMHMKFVNFFSQELHKPGLPSSQKDEIANSLSVHVEAVNNVMRAVEKFMDTEVRTHKK